MLNAPRYPTMQTAFEAALSWDANILLTSVRATCVEKHVLLDGPGEGFGLLEPYAGGWTLCIPDGAELEASVDDRPIDRAHLWVDASGERRLPVCAGLRARVRMGEFRFEVRPATS